MGAKEEILNRLLTMHLNIILKLLLNIHGFKTIRYVQLKVMMKILFFNIIELIQISSVFYLL
jgi:hypothetical protein